MAGRMEWQDEAFVLAAHPHGEGGAVVQLLTRYHGRHAGMVHGRSARALAQPGNRVSAVWRGRLAEHLGHYRLEPLAYLAATLLDSADRLAGLQAACAVAATALPEGEDCGPVFAAFATLADSLGTDRAGTLWPAIFIHWELGLLASLGFGLVLDHCAVSGDSLRLAPGEAGPAAYVSPRTGRAVSAAAAAAWRDRLLPLPAFLRRRDPPDREGFAAGLRLTGYFLDRHIFRPLGRPVPNARTWLADRPGIIAGP